MDKNVPVVDTEPVQNDSDRGGDTVTVDASIEYEIRRSAKRLEITDPELIARAVETGQVAQEEGLDFDSAFDMARLVLVRATLAVA